MLRCPSSAERHQSEGSSQLGSLQPCFESIGARALLTAERARAIVGDKSGGDTELPSADQPEPLSRTEGLVCGTHARPSPPSKHGAASGANRLMARTGTAAPISAAGGTLCTKADEKGGWRWKHSESSGITMNGGSGGNGLPLEYASVVFVVAVAASDVVNGGGGGGSIFCA